MKKVRLRYYKKEDFDFLHEMLSDPETVKFFPMMYTTSKEQSRLRLETRLWDEESDYANRYVIQDFFTRKPVGEISGRIATDKPDVMELAVLVHPKYRRQGYARAGTWEFMKKVIKENRGINKFRLEFKNYNEASKALAQGMEFDFSKYNGKDLEWWEKDVDDIEK